MTGIDSGDPWIHNGCDPQGQIAAEVMKLPIAHRHGRRVQKRHAAGLGNVHMSIDKPGHHRPTPTVVRDGVQGTYFGIQRDDAVALYQEVVHPLIAPCIHNSNLLQQDRRRPKRARATDFQLAQTMYTPLSTLLLLTSTTCAEPRMDPINDRTTPAASVTGTIRVDPAPDAKKFQGVWLEATDGSKQLIADNTRSVWARFEGQTVWVTGEPYTPDLQSSTADHFRVETMSLANRSQATLYTRVDAKRQMNCHIQVHAGSPGSKMADQSWRVLLCEGLAYQLANPVMLKGHTEHVSVVARPVERALFTAHMPGPMLWIESVN